MRKFLSELCAACLIGVFFWVSYWMAAVIETGIPMPKHVFVIMICIYSSIILGVIVALIVGIAHLILRRRHLEKTKRVFPSLYIDGSGNIYTKK